MMQRKHVVWGIVGFILLFFVWSRLWNIQKTMEFFADSGRDHYVLLRAFQTRKPPLLGPSNGAIPFNQSPIYYYLNIPVFVLSRGSAYTTVITLTLLFLVTFAHGFSKFRSNKVLFFLFLVFTLLVTFHPQFMDQHRHPWNPTFTVPFLLLSIFTLLQERMKDDSGIWLFAFGIAFALGCSYSVFPTCIVLVAYVLLSRKAVLKDLIVPFFVTHLIVFLPFVLIELRSNFMMSRRLLLDIQLHQIHSEITHLEKIQNLLRYIVGATSLSWQAIAFVFGLIIISAIFAQRRKLSQASSVHLVFFTLFCCSFLFTILSPFPFQPHYIFGVLTLFLLTIASMKRQLLCIVLFILISSWWPSFTAQLRFVPHRTIAQLDACARLVCSKEQKPIYVSVQAWHSYHFAPEHLFFLNKNGCMARDITQDPGVSDRMAVVVDNSSYSHEHTAYNELTLFGPNHVDTTYTCDGNIQVVMLKK